MVFSAERAARAAQPARPSALRAHARAAQLAGGFLGFKKDIYECQNLLKPTLYCFLCKNLQLLLMQHHLTSILNLPYYVLSMRALACKREGVYLYEHFKITKRYKTTNFYQEINNF